MSPRDLVTYDPIAEPSFVASGTPPSRSAPSPRCPAGDRERPAQNGPVLLGDSVSRSQSRAARPSLPGLGPRLANRLCPANKVSPAYPVLSDPRVPVPYVPLAPYPVAARPFPGDS